MVRVLGGHGCGDDRVGPGGAEHHPVDAQLDGQRQVVGAVGQRLQDGERSHYLHGRPVQVLYPHGGDGEASPVAGDQPQRSVGAVEQDAGQRGPRGIRADGVPDGGERPREVRRRHLDAGGRRVGQECTGLGQLFPRGGEPRLQVLAVSVQDGQRAGRPVTVGEDLGYLGERHVDPSQVRGQAGLVHLCGRVPAVAGDRVGPGGSEHTGGVVEPQRADG